MPLRSVLLKSLVFTLFVFCRQANAQNDTTWYIFGDTQITLLNSFQSQDFSKGWTEISSNTSITSFEAGILFRSRTEHKNFSGINFRYSSSSSDALSRSKNVRYVELGRTISYTSSDEMSLKILAVGYYFSRSFKETGRSGFFINPAILFGTMKEKFIREFASESDVKGTGFELISGVTWHPLKEIGLKVFIGYRALKMKIDAFESTGEPVVWSGPFLGAGIRIAIP
jgi:hypothetical protein